MTSQSKIPQNTIAPPLHRVTSRLMPNATTTPPTARLLTQTDRPTTTTDNGRYMLPKPISVITLIIIDDH